MAELKHVARVKATGKKCIVAFRTLPGDAYNCLIVPTENLPDSYHDTIINLVESNAGQSAGEFAEVMGRSKFPDGSTILAALHSQNRLVKVSTDQIEMTPTNSTVVLLSELNQLIAEQRGLSVSELAIRSSLINESDVIDDAPVPQSIQPIEKTAAQYREEARKLIETAERFNKMADELEPSHVVEVTESTVVVDDTVTQTPIDSAKKTATVKRKTTDIAATATASKTAV